MHMRFFPSPGATIKQLLDYKHSLRNMIKTGASDAYCLIGGNIEATEKILAILRGDKFTNEEFSHALTNAAKLDLILKNETFSIVRALMSTLEAKKLEADATQSQPKL